MTTCLLLLKLLKPRSHLKVILCALAATTFGSLSVICFKAVSICILNTVNGHNQFDQWPTYIFIVAVLAIAPTNIVFMNKTFEEASAMYGMPLYQSLFILSTIGFGQGNYRDTLMEQLANKGDGNNFYVDSQRESDRIFGEQIGGTMITVARDTKVSDEIVFTRVEFSTVEHLKARARDGWINGVHNPDDRLPAPSLESGQLLVDLKAQIFVQRSVELDCCNY